MTDKARGKILEEALLAGSMEVDKGETASYIPELSRADKHDLGICIYTRDGEIYEAGDSQKRFRFRVFPK